MNSCYVFDVDLDFSPQPKDNVMTSIFKQYESVIVESIITSFGLEFLMYDQHGGDVDTIYNVRQVGKDEQMIYKNKTNLEAYEKRGKYDSKAYHTDKRYIEKNREIRKQKDSGGVIDAYTGEKIIRNAKSDLDHVVSAKEIDDDAGRVLAGLKGIDLANSSENLKVTNPHTNRTKKADSMEDFINKYGHEYTGIQKRNMFKKDVKAREAYERKIEKIYYTSPKFSKDVALAAGKTGIKLGFKQVLGFIFTEIWFAVKQEFVNIKGCFDLGKLLSAIGNGIRRGFSNAKEKYKELLTKFQESAIAGALSSLTTTLCNIFFTTAKNVTKIIRQAYASVVQALKILFINPDNLPFGERMRAAVKILATGASVIVGGGISEIIGKTPIGAIPIVGDIVQTFCGTLVTGIMSCTLLYFIDRSDIINKLVRILNKINFFSAEVNYFHKQAVYFERYAAELMKIDIKKFRKETAIYYSLAIQLDNSQSESELGIMLKNVLNTVDVKIPWEGNFDTFMSNTNDVLVFE